MNLRRYLLTVDVGTGSGRSVIFDELGRQISVAQAEWEHPVDPEYGGAVDFDCARNWKLICDCIRTSMRTAGIPAEQIAAVSATSLRYGMVCYDASGKEIFAVPNLDARAGDDTVRIIRDGWGPKVYQIQGEWPNIHALVRLLWLRRVKPQLFEQIRMMTLLSDWVIYRLSGEFFTEPSGASSSGIFDIHAREWSPELIELAGLRREYLPRVLDPGAQAGGVTRRAAEETALAVNTPVLLGMGDTQSGHVGCGVISPGDAGLVAGSFWLPAVISEHPLIDPQRRIRTNCHGPAGRWIIEGCTFLTGMAIRWFRDAFCQDEIARAKRQRRDPYELMEKLAEGVPAGSHGVQVILSDILNSSRWIHAAPAFLNFQITDPRKYGKGAFYRAILENAVYQGLGEVESIVRVCGRWPREIVFSGGGSKSPLICQMLADTLGIPVRVPAVREATALGAAVTSACGIGMYGGLQEACREMVRKDRCFEPDRELHETYRQGYATWRAIYPYMMQLVEKGLTQPLWKAPGTL